MENTETSNETITNRKLIRKLNNYINIDDNVIFNLKTKTQIDNTLIEKADIIQRLNHSIICNNIIFHNLKNEIESEYEFFEENVKEVNNLIKKGHFHYAAKLLDYLDEFIRSLRKNIY